MLWNPCCRPPGHPRYEAFVERMRLGLRHWFSIVLGAADPPSLPSNRLGGTRAPSALLTQSRARLAQLG
jgi:hypothetical protein